MAPGTQMIAVGDIVERPERRPTHSKGRVTGFAPNGRARVKLENGQQRIWPHERLRIIQKAAVKPVLYDHAWLMMELEKWVADCGEERALALCQKIWPNNQAFRD